MSLVSLSSSLDKWILVSLYEIPTNQKIALVPEMTVLT